MIEVGVGREADHWALCEQRQFRTQRADAEPGVDEKIAVAAANEPHVATDERIDLRLGDETHTIAYRFDAEPDPCDL